MIDEEDKKLYKKFLEGEQEAFEKIIKKYEKNIKYFILKYVKDIDASEDIFQSVIVYILENKEKYDNKYSLKTYLYTIAKSRALNYIKKQNKEVADLEHEETIYQEEKILEEIIISKQRREKIVSVMKKMNTEYQQVIYLIIIEGLSYDETAKIMGKSLSQIKNLVHRARKKMKKLLIEEKVIEMKNNKVIKLLIWTIIVVIISSSAVYATMKIYQNLKNNANLTPTFTAKIGNTDYNSVWVGTFNLVWNELMEEFTKGNVEFEEGNTKLVEELNKQYFKKDQLSKEDYYIMVAKTTPELKEEILRDIKAKFNVENASLLKDLSFEPTSMEDFTIYTMIYKSFEFINPFDKLDNGRFGINEEQVKYFGITNASREFLNSNVEILFYNNENDFAVKLKTKEKDNEEIILYRTDENKSFNNYYEEIKIKKNSYKGRTQLGQNDELRVPYINVDTVINYDELCGKRIKHMNGLFIRTAMQNIKFSLNEKGGNMTSEAVIMGSYNSYSDELPIHFYFDDTFILFMKETDKEQPYMSLKIDNTDVLVRD